MRADVLPFGGDVGVDVELKVAILGERVRAFDSAIEKVREPEKLVLFANCPVEVHAAVGVGAAWELPYVVVLGLTV